MSNIFGKGYGFYFNGHHSSEFHLFCGVVNNNGTQTYKPNLLTTKQPIWDETLNRNYYYGAKKDNLTIKIPICTNQDDYDMTENDIYSIKAWLSGDDNFHELILDDELMSDGITPIKQMYSDKVYFCNVFTNPEINIINSNGTKIYGEITFQSCFPYGFSEEFSQYFNAQTSITLTNNGIQSIKPLIKLLANEATITITNSTTNQSIVFDGLAIGETIFIDCDYKKIYRNDLAKTNRFKALNVNNKKIDFTLAKGANEITVSGSCDLTFTYRFAY